MKKLRMIHNMARSGSTLLCKCLGSMEGVALLSELHPLAWNIFNPLKQASEWFGLLTAKDVAQLKTDGDVAYSKVIALIEQKCTERGRVLVLRDWAHLDYTGYPFFPSPSFRPLLYEELKDSFEIVRISTTRDPVTQWQSLIQLGIMQDSLRSGAFGLVKYLAGYRKYAELCVETGFIRFEDLLENPQVAMRNLCEKLELTFDPGFIDKWHGYNTITGDINNPRSSNKIKLPPGRPIDASLRESFLAIEDYHRVCELLGYQPIQALQALHG